MQTAKYYMNTQHGVTTHGEPSFRCRRRPVVLGLSILFSPWQISLICPWQAGARSSNQILLTSLPLFSFFFKVHAHKPRSICFVGIDSIT